MKLIDSDGTPHAISRWAEENEAVRLHRQLIGDALALVFRKRNKADIVRYSDLCRWYYPRFVVIREQQWMK